MLTAIALVVLAIFCRLASPILHTWNFVPMGAVALYAGARLPRRWAWLVPVAALVLSDIVLDYGRSRPLFELSRWTVYVTIAATCLVRSARQAAEDRSLAASLPGSGRLDRLLPHDQPGDLGGGAALSVDVAGPG